MPGPRRRWSLEDLHVYGGLLLLAAGAALIDRPFGLCVLGIGLLLIGLLG